MNNFTKEELTDILDSLRDSYIYIKPELIVKIQSLIDNYCEHNKCPNCDLNQHSFNVDCIKLNH